MRSREQRGRERWPCETRRGSGHVAACVHTRPPYTSSVAFSLPPTHSTSRLQSCSAPCASYHGFPSMLLPRTSFRTNSPFPPPPPFLSPYLIALHPAPKLSVPNTLPHATFPHRPPYDSTTPMYPTLCADPQRVATLCKSNARVSQRRRTLRGEGRRKANHRQKPRILTNTHTH